MDSISIIKKIIDIPSDFLEKDYRKASFKVAHCLGLNSTDFPESTFGNFYTGFKEYITNVEKDNIETKVKEIYAICQIIYTFHILHSPSGSPNTIQGVSIIDVRDKVPNDTEIGVWCQIDVSELPLSDQTSLANTMIALAKYYKKEENNSNGFKGTEMLKIHAFIMVIFYLLYIGKINGLLNGKPVAHSFSQLVSTIKTISHTAERRDKSGNDYGYKQLINISMLVNKEMTENIIQIFNYVRGKTINTFVHKADSSYPLMSWIEESNGLIYDNSLSSIKKCFELKKNNFISVSNAGDLRSCLAVLSFHDENVEYIDNPSVYGNHALDCTIDYPSEVRNGCVTVIGSKPSSVYCEYRIAKVSDTDKIIKLLAKELVNEPLNKALESTRTELYENLKEPYEEIISRGLTIVCTYQGTIIGACVAYNKPFSDIKSNLESEELKKYGARDKFLADLQGSLKSIKSDVNVLYNVVDSRYTANDIENDIECELYDQLLFNLQGIDNFKYLGCVYTSINSEYSFPNIEIQEYSHMRYRDFKYKNNPFFKLNGHGEYMVYDIRKYNYNKPLHILETDSDYSMEDTSVDFESNIL